MAAIARTALPPTDLGPVALGPKLEPESSHSRRGAAPTVLDRSLWGLRTGEEASLPSWSGVVLASSRRLRPSLSCCLLSMSRVRLLKLFFVNPASSLAPDASPEILDPVDFGFADSFGEESNRGVRSWGILNPFTPSKVEEKGVWRAASGPLKRLAERFSSMLWLFVIGYSPSPTSI